MRIDRVLVLYTELPPYSSGVSDRLAGYVKPLRLEREAKKINDSVSQFT